MVYLDYNAGAPLRPEVAELLARCAGDGVTRPGNPSSVHAGGRAARARMDDARAKVATLLGCEPREVCFTSSGSEADALAVLGAFRGRKEPARRRVVASAIEHPAVLGASSQLEREGAVVTRVAPDPSGRVPVGAVLEALTPETSLCSLMWANNETGVLQPVAEVAQACRERGIVFHTDAVQAAGKLPLSLREVAADLLSLSSHKLGGPAGIGALVIRRGVPIQPIIPGHQEGGRRGGTPDVSHLEAFALALELATRELGAEGRRLAALRERFEAEVQRRVEGARVNGAAAERVPNTSSLSFDDADGEALLIALDLEGYSVSSGAACASGSLTPSHVLTAMGLSPAQAHGSLRFSFGLGTTEDDVRGVVEALARLVPKVTG